MPWYSEKEFLLKIPKHSQKKKKQSLFLKIIAILSREFWKKISATLALGGNFQKFFKADIL